MTYYKVLNEDGFIGVGTTENLVKYQKKHNTTIGCPAEEAECIMIGGTLYHDRWMLPFNTTEYEYSNADVQVIEKDEYDALLSAMESGEEIKAVEEPQETSEPDETEAEDVTVDYVRSVKLKELGLACNRAITTGFDIELSDGEQHHFSMTLQDQANLNSASMQIFNGDSEVPYHADGEEYKNFSSEDMIAVIGAANAHKMRNLAYFGCLKEWLNSLVRVKSLQAVEYGSEIPKKYQSALYKSLCAG